MALLLSLALLLPSLLLLLPAPLSLLSALGDGTLLQPTAKASASNTGIILITDFFICLNLP
ncbi:MAG TPA: hypothetical protein VL155_11770 [Terriglobales bacterium]|jgi:hypothetical protein|nr:hypothetical protein [Terriglobales bacterium]